MTRVDFYVLGERAAQARELFACRLTEKAWRLKHRVYLHAASGEAAREVDQLLWTFRDGSFVPHALEDEAGEAAADRAPVRIGAGGEPRFEAELLINLGHEVPLFFSRFDRVAEIVAGTDEEKAAARERFRFYRDRGYALETHQIGAARP